MVGIAKNPRQIILDLIKLWVQENVETLAPATVVSNRLYEEERVLDVLPLILEKQEDGDIIVPDVIYNAPVSLQGSTEGVFSFPIKPGDKVLIGYVKRSLEEFIYANSPDQYLPRDTRVFGSSDAVVVGFLGQAGVDLPVSVDDAFWQFNETSITLDKDNNITIKTGDDTTVKVNSDSSIELSTETSDITQSSSGEVSISNDAGSGTLQPSGNWLFNGTTIDTSGNVITASGTNLDALRAIFNIHTHISVSSLGTPTPPPQQV